MKKLLTIGLCLLGHLTPFLAQSVDAEPRASIEMRWDMPSSPTSDQWIEVEVGLKPLTDVAHMPCRIYHHEWIEVATPGLLGSWYDESGRHYSDLGNVQVEKDIETAVSFSIKIPSGIYTGLSLKTGLGGITQLIDTRPGLECSSEEYFERRFYRCLPDGTECERHPDPCGVLCYRTKHRAADLVEQFKQCRPGFAETIQQAAANQARLQPVVKANPQPLAQPKPYTPKRAKWMVLRIDQNRKKANLEEPGTYLLGAIENHQQELDEILNADPDMYARFIAIVDRFGDIAPRIAGGSLNRADLPELKDLQHESDGWLHDLYRLSSKPLEHAFKKARNSEKQAVMKAL